MFLVKVFWKYEANLEENTHIEVRLQWSCKATLLKPHFGMGVLLQICCIFSQHLFLRTPLEGCFCKLIYDCYHLLHDYSWNSRLVTELPWYVPYLFRWIKNYWIKSFSEPSSWFMVHPLVYYLFWFIKYLKSLSNIKN